MPAIVAALIIGSLAFAFLTAFARSESPFSVVAPDADRYIYIVAALWLPIVGLGGQWLAQRWLPLGVLPLVLLVIGLPGNIDALQHPSPYALGLHDSVVAAAHSPLLQQLPGDTRLFTTIFADLGPTAGFLRQAVADGRVPRAAVSATSRRNADAAIALQQTGPSRTTECPTRPEIRTKMRPGARIVFSGLLSVRVVEGDTSSTPRVYNSRLGDTVQVRAGPVELVVGGATPSSICVLERG